MTAIGSICTRPRTDRTLICNAVLYHFQITLFRGPINRQMIPLTLFLLSRPLEQLEFIRFSNFPAEPCSAQPIRPQRFMLPRYFQRRYRRHLLHFKLLFQIIRANDLLINFLVSVFTSYKNLRSVAFNLGSTCFSTTSRHAPPKSPACRNNLHNALFSSITSSLDIVFLRSLAECFCCVCSFSFLYYYLRKKKETLF